MLSFVALSKRQLKLQEIKPRLVFEIHSSWQDFVKEKSRSKEILNPNSKICVVGPWKNQTRLQCQDCKSEITCLKCQNQFFEENTYLCTKCKKIHLRSTCPKCASTNIQKVGFLYSKIIDDLKKIFPRSSITANAKAFFRSQIAVTSINELDYLQPIYEIALVPYFGDMIDFPYLNFREKLFEKIWGLNSAAVRKIHLFGTDLERNGFTKYLTENNWPTFLKEEMEERARLKLPPFSKSVMLVAKCSKPETCEKARDAILKQLKTKVEVYNYSQSFKAGRFFQKTLLTFPHKNWQQYKKILINSSTNIHFEVDPIEFG